MAKKKKVKKYNLTERIRGYLLDSQISDPHELSVVLGCSPISEEVKEKEEKESDKRVDKIAYLIPVLHEHAHTLADGSVLFQQQAPEAKDHEIPDEIWEKTRHMMEHISFSTLLGSISQLVDMGLIKVPKEFK